jgi:ADP-ribosylglycohydrolase
MRVLTIENADGACTRSKDIREGKDPAMVLEPSSTSRRRGAILGLAVGDALGAAVEFQPPGSFAEVTEYRAGGPHGLDPGEWTDDTSMALALADSIAEVGWDLTDQAKRYVSWWPGGAYSVNGRTFDIGITTSRSLQRFRETGDARTSGDPSSRASGNGSIMRLAPVPVAFVRLFPDQIELLVERLVDSSRPTHGSPQCLSACAYFGVILCGLLYGLPREQVLDPDWGPIRHVHDIFPLHPEILDVAQSSFRTRRPPQIQGSGYVVRSLEAALWAFHDVASFRETVLRAVNLGDDADTTGAVCGQLAGACWGEEGTPAAWRENLAGKGVIEPILKRLIS